MSRAPNEETHLTERSLLEGARAAGESLAADDLHSFPLCRSSVLGRPWRLQGYEAACNRGSSG